MACTLKYCDDATAQEPKCLDEPQPAVQPSLKDDCEANEGTWLEDHYECEYVSQDACDRMYQ